MSRRNLTSIEAYSRALKNGKGLGTGPDYAPWLRVNDVSSRGKSVKIQGIKTDRTHHLLSGIELNFFLCAEFNDFVVDIREAFPLFPLDLAMRLAREAEYTYQVDPKSKDPLVLTTDFLLTIQKHDLKSYFAIAIKPEEELRDARVLARLEFERLWWSMLGVPWRLVTDKQLDRQIAQNIDWFSDAVRGRKRIALGGAQESIFLDLVNRIKPGIYEWDGLVEILAGDIGKEPKQMSSLLRAAIWHKYIQVDLTTPIQEQNLIQVLKFSSTNSEGSNYGAINS